jgi:prophage antirepressor-like protein
MENQIQIFRNPQFGSIRTEIVKGEPWFCAVDVCAALGIEHHRRAVGDMLDDDEKGVRKTDSLGGRQEMLFVTESGLYALIMRSRKPEAKAFRKWVTTEVLPSIRKHGGYMMATPEETPEEIMARALLLAQCTIDAAKIRADYEAARAERLELQSEEQQKQLQASAPKVQYYENVLAVLPCLRLIKSPSNWE